MAPSPVLLSPAVTQRPDNGYGAGLMAERFDFICGDATGLEIPAHPQALSQAGTDFLTRAFRQFGTIAPDNAVTKLAAQPCPGGSTGQKLFLTVDYLHPEPGLNRALFAKFSRDFDDDRRDWQRTEMASEARFVALSRNPKFPIHVPRGYFADYHNGTGTGLVITERVAYGQGAIETHRRKCMDWQTMADPLPYYRASITALARLAGAHTSGQLAPDIADQFPFDPAQASADPIRYADAELATALQHCRAFARDCPQLLPENVRTPAFLDQMERDAWTIRKNETVIRKYLISNPAMITLNHWNSHIDNAWFWREKDGLQCGLIDWGRVGQITFGSALWGGLSAAHHDIWDHHLDDLLLLFVREYHEQGGPRLTLAEIKQHLSLHMALMGIARMLAFPEIIRFRLPQCPRANGPNDAMFTPVAADPARNCLSIYTVLLKHWQRENFGAIVRAVSSQ